MCALLVALASIIGRPQETNGAGPGPGSQRVHTAGNTELYLSYIEILDHCVNWDELLDCAEFKHAGELSDKDCDLAIGAAHLMCIVIGAPVTESVTIP